MNNTDIHVIKHKSKGWAVKRTGAKRCLKTFKDPFDAVIYAKQLGREKGLTVFYHNDKGMVYNREIFIKESENE